MSINKVILIGNVGQDPEIKTLETGTKVARFSVATSERWKDQDGNQKTNTQWHRIIIWKHLAEVVEKYVRKGSQLFLEGKINTREWTDKDGVKHWSTEIICNQMTMLGSKQDDKEPNPDALTVAKPEKTTKSDNPELDDLPF